MAKAVPLFSYSSGLFSGCDLNAVDFSIASADDSALRQRAMRVQGKFIRVRRYSLKVIRVRRSKFKSC